MEKNGQIVLNDYNKYINSDFITSKKRSVCEFNLDNHCIGIIREEGAQTGSKQRFPDLPKFAPLL